MHSPLQLSQRCVLRCTVKTQQFAQFFPFKPSHCPTFTAWLSYTGIDHATSWRNDWIVLNHRSVYKTSFDTAWRASSFACNIATCFWNSCTYFSGLQVEVLHVKWFPSNFCRTALGTFLKWSVCGRFYSRKIFVAWLTIFSEFVGGCWLGAWWQDLDLRGPHARCVW